MYFRPLTTSICFLTLALPLVAEERYGLEAAKAAMSNFKTPTGLKATLFAAEPMVQNPTNIEVDPSGRVWATECVNYRRWGRGDNILRPEGDRVVILEDTNNDGLADKDTTFFQQPDLKNPLGICVIPGSGGGKKGTQVIVSAAPNVWLLTDSDGDDKADKSEIIFKVGGSPDHDHQIHSFVVGFDGKLYFNFGNEGRKLMWPDGSVVKDVAGNEVDVEAKNNSAPYRQGMVFRCDLTNGKISNVESLGWNFRNNYEVCVDSFGGKWQSDNDDDGNAGVRINFVMDYGNYGYTDEITGANWNEGRTNIESEIPKRHWHLNDPGVVPNLLQTGAGSPTGILINEGTALGETFTNQLIHCDAGPRTVRAYPTKPDGAGYTAEMVDILTTSDQWYRPSDVAIGTDGALFVSDWYDPGVGGHAMGDNQKGKIMGRIYRVAPEAKPAPVKLNFTSGDGLIAALQSPNSTVRTTAWIALHAAGPKAESSLLKLWKDKNPRMRARALSVLTQIKGSELKYIAAGLTDANPDVRCCAVRLIRLFKAGGLNVSALESNQALSAKLLSDPNAAVRRELAISCRGNKDATAKWVQLAQQYDGKDRWYLEALGIGAAGNDIAFMDAWLNAVGEKWNTPAGRDIIWRLRTAKSPTYMAQWISDKSTSDADRLRYLRAFDFLPRSDERRNALIAIATDEKVAERFQNEALRRLRGSQRPEVIAAFNKALDRTKGTTPFVELVRDLGVKGQGQPLLDVAFAHPGHQYSNDAMSLIVNEADWQKLLAPHLEGDKAEQIISMLGATGAPQAHDYLVTLAIDSTKPLLQPLTVRALSRTEHGAERIIQLAKEGKLTDSQKATAATALRMVQYGKLKNDIDQLFPAPSALGGKALAPISELVKLPADNAKGQALFEKVESTCITCHRVGDKGVDFGPALTEIGSKLPKEAIFEAIINPNSGVSMGFETTQISTANGGGGTGIVRSETAEELVLMLPGGVQQKFPAKSVIKREKIANSLMPSGLNQALSQEDLVNMVGYLSTLKKP